MMTDIEIAQQCRMYPIADIAATAGIDEEYLEQYGRYKAKIDSPSAAGTGPTGPDGKLIFVTAINPHARQARARPPPLWVWPTVCGSWAKNAVAALREPSLGSRVRRQGRRCRRRLCAGRAHGGHQSPLHR